MTEYVDMQMPQDDIDRMLMACEADELDFVALDSVLLDFVTSQQRCAEVIAIFATYTAHLIREHFQADIDAMRAAGRDWMFALAADTVSNLPEDVRTAMQIVAALTNQDQPMFDALLITHMNMGEGHGMGILSAQAYVYWLLYTHPHLIGARRN